jgi:hypothetical protein
MRRQQVNNPPFLPLFTAERRLTPTVAVEKTERVGMVQTSAAQDAHRTAMLWPCAANMQTLPLTGNVV